MKEYPKIVQEIHNSFNMAGELLLKQAETILSEKIEEKAVRLNKLGFKNALGVAEAKELHLRQQESIKQADLIRHYQYSYPNNKFITEDMVMQINKKYNLVCAPIAHYKGFVPEEKISAMEKFTVKQFDKFEGFITNINFGYIPDRQQEAFERIKKLNKIPVSAFWLNNTTNIIDAKKLFPELTFVGNNDNLFHLSSYTVVQKEGFEICAPRKDMDLTGLTETKEGFFAKLVRVEVPDPVVLQPVKGGYLIVTAWGDEASDEIVVNHKMN